MKKLIFGLLAPLTMVALWVPVLAAPEESLQVLVTPTLVSVSLSESTVNFGAVALNQEKTSSTVPVATNNGTVLADLDIKGTNATYNGNTWALSDSANGADQYMLSTSTDGWTSEITLSTVYKDLYNSLDVGAGQSFGLKIKTPTSTSAYGEYSASVYVLATQH